MSKVVILKRPVRANGGLNQIGSRIRVPERYAQALVRQRAAEIVDDQPKRPKGPKPIAKMTKAELLAFAADKGLELDDGMTKAELLELLQG